MAKVQIGLVKQKPVIRNFPAGNITRYILISCVSTKNIFPSSVKKQMIISHVSLRYSHQDLYKGTWNVRQGISVKSGD